MTLTLHISGSKANLPSLPEDGSASITLPSDWTLDQLEEQVRKRLRIRVPFCLKDSSGEDVSDAPMAMPALHADPHLTVQPLFNRGTRVRAQNMRSRADLNGKTGTVALLREGRVAVVFDSGEKGLLEQANVAAVDTVGEVADASLREMLSEPQDQSGEWVLLEQQPPEGAAAGQATEPSQPLWVPKAVASDPTLLSRRTKGVRRPVTIAGSIADTTMSRRPPPTAPIRPKRVSRMHINKSAATSSDRPVRPQPAPAPAPQPLPEAVADGSAPLTAALLAAHQESLKPLSRDEQKSRIAAVRAQVPGAGVKELIGALLPAGWDVAVAVASLRTAAAEAAAAEDDTAAVESTAAAADELAARRPQPPRECVYHCRRCRMKLFTSEDTSSHEASAKAFRSAGKHHKKDTAERECASVWLTAGAVQWVEEQTADEPTVGTLQCPGCHAKLGAWNCNGLQCSCGAWICPAVQVHLSRLDCIPAAPP
eukprot:TRINITY_DN9474_c2_g1_i1.p1 TRINITY_DN9474_c2_g1~~TRINITY_DN9474_c2_g1_i1.p1  ORF type:complete len:494 (+),score=48.03 TRINITY_DN9474_c2_g1_i1:39-1484(+)